MQRANRKKIHLKSTADVRRDSTYNPREFRGNGWEENSAPKRESGWGWWVIGFVVLDIVVVAILLGAWSTPDAKPLPPTGTIKQPIQVNPAKTAPLRLNAGKGPYNYYVRLTDAATGTVVQEFFVRKAESANVRVALGRYHLEYAYGEQWEGDVRLFGSRTRKVKFPDPIPFRHEGGRALGMSVNLEPL